MRPAAAGFTLVEVLVATALMVTFSTALMSLLMAGQMFARTQPEAADLQQRARIVLQTLGGDLALAGAGVDRGPLAGSLAAYFAPVGPSLNGGLTVWYVSNRAAQATLSAPFASGQVELSIRGAPHCPSSEPTCAFRAAATAIVFDSRGCHDFLRIDAVLPAALQVRSRSTTCAYAADAAVAEGEVRTYYVDAPSRQLLRRDEATGLAVPILDGVTAMNVELLEGGRRLRLTLRLAPAASNPLVPALEVSCDIRPPNLQPQ